MNWHKFGTIFLVLNCWAFGSLFAKSPQIAVRYENFKVYYKAADEKRAMAVLTLLKKVIPKYEKFYGVTLNQPVSIYLPSTRQEFNRLSNRNLPDWSGAVFLPRHNRIVLKKTEWTTGELRLDRELPHELSHAFFNKKFENQSMPLWFNEGLAEFLSGELMDTGNGVRIANALFANQILPLTHIDSLLLFSASKARLAYLQSLTVILFMQNRFIKNDKQWDSFFHSINKTGFETALHQLTGMDFIDFEIKWYRWLQDKYKWFIVFNLENLIWIAMILVLVGALYAIRYRNRKILSKWEMEESVEGSYGEPYNRPEYFINGSEEKY